MEPRRRRSSLRLDLPDRPGPPVTIYRLIAKGTIEEKIIRLHHTKKDLADSLLEGTDLSHKLTREEILELLRQE